MQFNDLVWELVERKNSEDIHKAELPKFLFLVVDFMECRTERVGTATELLTKMNEEVTPNMVTKYLGQFAYEVLEPLGIEYRTKRTGKADSSNFCAVTAMTQMTPGSLYKEIPVITVIAVTNRRKGVNKCAAKTTGSMSV